MNGTKKEGAVWGKGNLVHAEYRGGLIFASQAFCDEVHALTEAGSEIRLLLELLGPDRIYRADDLPRSMESLN